jgi:cell division GTPase FtsZ
LVQVNEAAETIYEQVDSNCNLIFGAVIDPSLSQTEVHTPPHERN